MGDDTCILDKEKKMCVFGETAPMEGDWVFMPSGCPDDEPTNECAKHMKCGECMDDLDCVFDKKSMKCAFGQTADPDAGDWIFMKESCPDMCRRYQKCDTCMGDDTCIFDKEKKMCVFGETAPMEGDWVFMTSDCPDDEPTNECAKHMKCGECMDDLDCVFDKKSMKCAFGETADPDAG